MSRAQQNLVGRLRLAPAAVGLAAALALVGCSAGQITQTDSQLPAVNGTQATQGDIALRDVKFAYPESGSYAQGADAPMILSIVNAGSTADTLTSVTSPVAGEVTVTGSGEVPGGFRVAVGTPGAEVGSAASETSAPSSSATAGAPSSTATPPPNTPAAVNRLGSMQIELKAVNTELFPGKTFPVTFVFAQAGPITVEVPIAAPSDPRPEAEHDHGEGGH
ncbi:copper chaperone PCu(A)C [Actinokineospora pegani]|uniref:hypothetical protein n=1 Tax=Actinokineospora pegani TaxID=2654637 RepID=UPI0012EA2FF7|nr:hypothetical protein [Actinokineospora pegani]